MAISDSLNLFRMAQRLSVPQLVQALKDGTIDPSIGQLVLNNKMQMQKRMQNAQAAAQPPKPSVAQANMADGERLSGIASMPQLNNLYGRGFATGGIVGYADGGAVSMPRSTIKALSDYTGYSEDTLRKALPKLGVSAADGFDTILAKLKGLSQMSPPSPAPFPAMAHTVLATKIPGMFGLTGAGSTPEEQPPTPPGVPPAPPQEPPQQQPPQGEGTPGIGGGSYTPPNLMGYGDVLAKLNGDTAAERAALSKQRADEYGAGDKEAFAGIQSLIDKQKAGVADVDKKNMYLSIIKGGLAAAAGPSQYAMQNIANGGIEGVNNYIQRDVLNQAAKNQISQAEQMMRLQQLANAKGNKSLGDQYADREMQYRQNAQQIQSGIINAQNANEINKAQLQMQKYGIDTNAGIQRAMIGSRDKYYDALEQSAKARQIAAMQKFGMDFEASQGNRELQALLKKQYGEGWRLGKDPKSLEAQMIYGQERQKFIMNKMQDMNSLYGGIGGLQGGMGGGDVPSFEDRMAQ